MNKIQAERLLNVARALRESPTPQAFTMNIYSWGLYDEEADNEYDLNFACGTPACALGHYAARSDLQDLLFIGKQNGVGAVTVRYRDSLDLVCFAADKVQEHFGIDSLGTDELFNTDGCGKAETAIEAATYIEEFVAQRTTV